MGYSQKLREERVRRGWTQKVVADLIELPDFRTLGRWERGLNFPSPHYCRELARIFDKSLEELGLNNHSLKPPVDDSTPVRVFNRLPMNFSSFVGRGKEVVEVCALLQRDNVRLLTLFGSGGIGKTRLCIESAIQVQDHFADGVCYVPLTMLRDSTALLPTIATALGIQESVSLYLEQLVKTFLRNKQVLLLLDNFEQVASAAPLIEELLQECPQIKVLVTSRHVLQLEAEHTFIVPPLLLPDLKVLPTTTQLMRYAAIALFVDRVQTRLSTFKITDENARAIAELCVHLDGLPLAIELAAASIKLFSPQTLLTRLLRDQQILKSELSSLPTRHRTLYATIQWSYNLLDEQEQWLFRHLSLFVGGASLETIEVCFANRIPSSTTTIIKIVESLLNKSLLQRIEQDDGEPRFCMLETIRTYAFHCLQEKGELEEQWRVYVLYYLELVERAAPFLKKMQQAMWLTKMDQELDNLRSVLTWLLKREETDLALRFAEAFGKFCGLRGYWHEEQHLLNAVLQLPITQEQEIRGRVLRRAGHVAYRMRDLVQARTLLEQSVTSSRKNGDWQNLVGSLSTLGWVMYRQNDLDAARVLLEECVAITSFANDYWTRANALDSLGRFVYYQGNLEEAYTLLQESVAIARAHLDKESLARILTTLVHLEVSRGNQERAIQLAQESALLARELNTQPLIALTLGTLGTVALFQGNDEQAQGYFEDRIAIATELGDLPALAHTKLEIATIALAAKDFVSTEQLLNETIELLQHHPDASDLIMAQAILGDVKYLEGDIVQAKEFYLKGLRYVNASTDKRKTGRCLMGLAQVLLAQNMAERATYLLGAAEACLKQYDMYPKQYENLQQIRGSLQDFLDPADFARIWDEGNAAPREQILSVL